jgi:hypothetical protein
VALAGPKGFVFGFWFVLFVVVVSATRRSMETIILQDSQCHSENYVKHPAC